MVEAKTSEYRLPGVTKPVHYGEVQCYLLPKALPVRWESDSSHAIRESVERRLPGSKSEYFIIS
jgi:hypothetical protein